MSHFNVHPLPVPQTNKEEEAEAVVANSLASRAVVFGWIKPLNMNRLDRAHEFDSYEIEEPSDEDRAASRSEVNVTSAVAVRG